MKYELINKVVPEYSIEELLLTNRGIPYEKVSHYLNTTDDDLNSPYLLDNIEEAAKTFLKHVSKKNKICIIVDSDADGFTSSALLINYINLLAGVDFTEENVQWIFHEGKQHGIELARLPQDFDLLIVPDAGSNDYEEHKVLKEKGIDIIVLDHHEAEKVSENAIIVNNHLCDYPNKDFSGVGITYKFCQVLDDLTGNDYAENFLDLVALGLIGDMVEIKNFETRHLITKGLKDVKNPFFKTLAEANSFSIGGELNPISVAFYIVPFINAMNRSGTQEEKELLFDSMLEHKADIPLPSTKRGHKPGDVEILVDQACRICKNVKARQTKSQDNLLKIIENKVLDENLLDNKIIFIQLRDTDVDKNLRGLVANKLASKYQRPTIIVSKDDKTNTWSGSARGYSECELEDFKKFVVDTGLLIFGEGHANAFGFSIKDENVENFIKETNEKLKDIDFSIKYLVDMVIEDKLINSKDILKISSLSSLWGQGFPEPYIVLKNMVITKDNIFLRSPDKNPTLVMKYTDDIEIIKFKSSKEEYEGLLEAVGEMGCAQITVIGKCSRNEWMGKITAQLKLIEFEIEKKICYYF